MLKLDNVINISEEMFYLEFLQQTDRLHYVTRLTAHIEDGRRKGKEEHVRHVESRSTRRALTDIDNHQSAPSVSRKRQTTRPVRRN